MDSMQSRKSGNETFCIGMDCGGSRTRALLADLGGGIVARAVAGPGNPLSAGFEAAEQAYWTAIRGLLSRAGLGSGAVAAVAIGTAGAGRTAERKRITASLKKILPRARIAVDSDAAMALLGATRGKPGIIAISGTGSIVLGMGENREIVRAGGWGLLLGDEGSGGVLGLEAIRAVLRAEDGRAPATCLRDAVLRHFRVRTPAGLITRIYRKPPTSREYARILPALLAAAREGDGVARSLLRSAGAQLAAMVEAVATRLAIEGTVPLVLSGGVLSSDTLLRRTMLRRLRASSPRIRIAPAIAPPEMGALLVARSLVTRQSI